MQSIKCSTIASHQSHDQLCTPVLGHRQENLDINCLCMLQGSRPSNKCHCAKAVWAYTWSAPRHPLRAHFWQP